MKTSIQRVRARARFGISTDERDLEEAYAEARLESNVIEQDSAAGVKKCSARNTRPRSWQEWG
jgi:hypothetical protein